MPAGVTDPSNLFEIRLRAGAEPVYERPERVRAGSILRFEFAQLGLRAAHHELGERGGVPAKSGAERLEGGREFRGLGDRVTAV
jgi:hypothetical protein